MRPLLWLLMADAEEVEVSAAGQAITYSPNDPTARHRDRGIERDEAGDILGALEAFQAAVRFQPAEPSSWNNYGVVLVDERNPRRDLATYHEAHDHFIQALKLDENEETRENLEELEAKRWEYLPPGHHNVELPRFTPDELRKNETYLNCERPFILVGAQKNWSAREKWSLDYFAESFPHDIADYYPNSMHLIGNKPFLRKVPDAVAGFKQRLVNKFADVDFGADGSVPPYIQWRMNFAAIHKVHRDGDVRWPFNVQHDLVWMKRCMPDIDNMIRFAQWNMMSVGMKGSGMFFHPDGMGMSSMAVQIRGRKRWMICEQEMSEFLYKPGDLNTFRPDLERFPKFAKANCSDVVANPGDILLYPFGTWHQTYNLDEFTVSVQSRMVTRSNFRDIYAEMQRNCEHPPPDITADYPGASPNLSDENCDAIDDCLDLWSGWFEGDTPFNFSLRGYYDDG